MVQKVRKLWEISADVKRPTPRCSQVVVSTSLRRFNPHGVRLSLQCSMTMPPSSLPFLIAFAFQHTTPPPAKDDEKSPAVSAEAKPEAAALEIESGSGGGKMDAFGDQARSAALSAAIEDRNTLKGKWRKAGDREAIRSDTAKRRRSSGWFKRLTSSFQTSRPRSASEEFQDRLPSTLHEIDDIDTGGDDAKSFWLRSTAPATMSSLQSTTDRFLFREDVAEMGASLRNGRDAGPRPAGSAKSPASITREHAAGSIAVGEDLGLAARTGGDGSGETQATAEEEDSEYETGSNTTEGFGSDDAGDLWEGRRSTLMELLERASPMPDRTVAAEEKHDEVGGESKGGINASKTSREQEEVADGDAVEAHVGHEEVAAPQALLEEAELTDVTTALSALDVAEPVVALPEGGADSAPDGNDGDDRIHKECNGDGGDATAIVPDVNDHGHVSASGGKGSKAEPFSGPVPAPRSTYFATVSPSRAPPSLLPAPTECEKDTGAKEDGGHLTPVVVEQQVPSPFSKRDSSPAISDDSSSKESPRAWRLSWWARASDRHPPPPPKGGEDNKEAGGGTDKSIAAALTAAAGGQEAAAAALSTGGAFAPSRNAGDRPAVVDGGAKTTSSEKVPESSVTVMAMAVEAAAAAAERRSKRRSMRRRREKPWLSKDKMTDSQMRPLEAASEYLDVVALARAGMVCRGWREPLSGDEGRRKWMRCVRLAEGVPEEWRAKFYLHVLYDQPSWVAKVR